MIKRIALSIAILLFSGIAHSEQVISLSNLTYLGAFRVPYFRAANNCDNSTGENGLISYYPKNNSLYVNGTDLNSSACANLNQVAEVSIPSTLSSTTEFNPTQLPATTFLQTYHDTANGNIWNTAWGATDGVNARKHNGGPVIIGSILWGTSTTWYAAKLNIYLFKHSLDLSDSNSYDGMYGLNDTGGTGITTPRYFTYFLGSIPSAYQSRLGGDMFGGAGGGSVISTTSNSPSFFVFNSSSIGTKNATSSSQLGSGKLLLGVSVNSSSTCTSNWPGCPQATVDTNDIWSRIGAKLNSGVIIPGTQTLMIFGTRAWGACIPKVGESPTSVSDCSSKMIGGTGNPSNFGGHCYGGGTPNLSEQCSGSEFHEAWGPACVLGNMCGGTVIANGNSCCYDPGGSDKGGHAYPYTPAVWFYDIGNSDGTNSSGNTVDDNIGGNCNTLTAVALGSSLTACFGGTRHPWDILPYNIATLDLPWMLTSPPSTPVSAAYDATNSKLYVSIPAASDPDSSYHHTPVIAVFDVNTGGGASGETQSFREKSIGK